MTDRLAIIIGAIVVVAIGYDLIANDGASCLFLLKKMMDLIEWMAFWR